jgi:hypothetical protein
MDWQTLKSSLVLGVLLGIYKSILEVPHTSPKFYIPAICGTVALVLYHLSRQYEEYRKEQEDRRLALKIARIQAGLPVAEETDDD